MTEDEAQKLIDETYPGTVDGQTRPADKLDISMPFNTAMPQLMSGDYAGPEIFNVMHQQLLSNDKALSDKIAEGTGGSTDAADINITDAAEHYAAANVEDALAEAATNIDTLKEEIDGIGSNVSGARVAVYVPIGCVVTCTDSAGTVTATKTAETEAKVTFDLGYGTYTFSTPTSTEGVNDTETVNVTELKIYSITLDGITDGTDTKYELDIIAEAHAVVTVTNGDVVQTKAIGASDAYISFVIPDGTASSTVTVTKEGVTRTETVSFSTDEYKKTVRVLFPKLTVTGKAGQTAVISKGTYSYTVAIEAANTEYTIYLPELGTWSVVATASDGEVTNKTASVTEYKTYYVVCNTKIYAFKIDGTVSDPAKMITYLDANKNFAAAKMNFDTGVFDWGDWDSQDFFVPRPCMLKYDGTVDYYLNENFFDLRADNGEASDVANPDYEGNAMMEWGRYGSKIWYKIVPSGTNNISATVYIANYQADSSYHAWSFYNSDGELADHFYTPIYNGTLVDGKMRSLSGCETTTNTTALQEISYAEANNPSGKKIWYTEVYADVTLINLLLMMLGKSTDTQTTFGYGNTNGSKQNTGQLDAYGMFYGTKSADLKGVKVFGMENWWGNVYRRYAGHVTNSSKQHLVKLTYGTQDGSTATGYNTTGNGYINTNVTPTGGGYLVQQQYGSTYGMVPYSVSSGSASTYYCDYFYLSTSRYALRGGYYSYGTVCGAFCVSLNIAASDANGNYGSAISFRYFASMPRIVLSPC